MCSDAWMLLLLCCVEEGYDGLESSTVPEMQRSDLAPVILQMKALGVSNIVRFNFLSVNWKGFRIPQSVLHEIYSDLLNYGIIWISIVLFHGHTKTYIYMWSLRHSNSYIISASSSSEHDQRSRIVVCPARSAIMLKRCTIVLKYERCIIAIIDWIMVSIHYL